TVKTSDSRSTARRRAARPARLTSLSQRLDTRMTSRRARFVALSSRTVPVAPLCQSSCPGLRSSHSYFRCPSQQRSSPANSCSRSAAERTPDRAHLQVVRSRLVRPQSSSATAPQLSRIVLPFCPPLLSNKGNLGHSTNRIKKNHRQCRQ